MGFFRDLFRTSKPPTARVDMPVLSRLADLESDMLEVRRATEKYYTSLRKLQGKVYRGVALGETTEAVTGDPPDVEELQGSLPFKPIDKSDLYKRAAALRGN